MKHLLALAAIALSTPAAANCDWKPDRVAILAFAAHYGHTTEVRSFVPGAMVVWECNRFSGSVGGFSNSFGDFSTAVMGGYSLASYEFPSGLSVELDAVAGFADYDDMAEFQLSHIPRTDLIGMVGVEVRVNNIFIQAQPGLFASGLTFDF